MDWSDFVSENSVILIADDEQRILNLVSDFLKSSGFKTLTAQNGAEASKIIESGEKIDLAILDIMMPELNGWELIKIIRKQSNMPIIMLSARSEEFDMLTSFENGADEYVTKPFSPAVLVKRVEALLKRSYSSKCETENIHSGLYIDTNAYLVYIDSKPLELTLKEFELLSHLYNNKGIVLSREQLLDAVWGYDYSGDFRTVDSHIARLRTKLGALGVRLKTIYGMGYKFEKE